MDYPLFKCLNVFKAKNKLVGFNALSRPIALNMLIVLIMLITGFDCGLTV